MLVVTFIVLRRKKLAAVTSCYPVTSCFRLLATLTAALGILAEQNPSFSSLPLLAYSGSTRHTVLSDALCLS